MSHNDKYAGKTKIKRKIGQDELRRMRVMVEAGCSIKQVSIRFKINAKIVREVLSGERTEV